MDAREHAGFDRDLADLIEGAAIGTAMVLEHFIAEDALLECVVALGAFFLLLFGQRLDTALLDLGDFGVAGELVVLLGVERVGEIDAGIFFDGGVELGTQLGGDEFALLFAGDLHQLADAGGDLLAAFVAELRSEEHTSELQSPYVISYAV